jgi:FG-GAP-like repeat/WD40-like Beta Propeller Repeat
MIFGNTYFTGETLMENSYLKYISKVRLAMASLAIMLFLFTGFHRSSAFAENQFSPPVKLSDKFDSTDVTATLGKLTFSQLVFTFGSPNLFVKTANADGTGETGLTGTIPPSSDPSWSPDGTKIVYSAFGPFDIFSMNADGSNKVNLTNTQSFNERNAVWSANGKIAYERDNQIWTMNADGSDQRLFSAITQPSPLSPAWSFDGAKLAFTSGGEVWTINADGTNQRRVTNNSTTDTNPAWSGDGTKIAFSKGSGIAVINADGTNEISLTSGDDREPAWSSDNTKIAFARKGTTVNGIYIMDTNGANQLRVIADMQTTRGTENDSPTWQPIRNPLRTPFDFDGDGRSDVSVFRPSNGVWYLNQSQNGFTGTSFGLSTDKLAPADYDGDGKTDLAVYRDGNWYLQRSQLGFTSMLFGNPTDVPVPADYDGDGKADLAVFRQSNGTWYLNQSTNGFAAIAFGVSTDKPVPADYNGDGRTEVALFRPSNGTWYLSPDPAINYGAVQFGASGDIPVPADYDGDGKADVAVYRNGTWYLNRSRDGFVGIVFGLGTDLPVAADYDGDGKADVAVFRNGTWYLNRSTSGFTGIAFGEATDKPLPNAFVR